MEKDKGDKNKEFDDRGEEAEWEEEPEEEEIEEKVEDETAEKEKKEAPASHEKGKEEKHKLVEKQTQTQKEKFECKFCHKNFGSGEGLKQHLAAKHRGSEEKAAEKKRKSYKGYIVIAIIILATIGLFWWVSKLPKVLGVGAHWHADYEVRICGERLPDFPASPGGVHTHGDGRIHIHPSNDAEAKENANIARFFSSLGGTLTNLSIILPDGRTYKNGDLCGDKTARVKVIVNGREREELEKYVPKDGDVVKIVFG